MVRPDYRRFITHSAKGSTWEKHKYIKRVDGTYYYPDSYKGGRHLPKNDGGEKNKSADKKASFLRDELNKLLSTNEAYYDPEEEYDVESFRDFYESITGKSSKDISDSEMKTILDSFKGQEKTENEETYELSKEDIEELAMEVWRGNFGNGQQRRDLLGEYYDEVQKRVNELAGSVGGKRPTNSVSQKEIDDAKNILDKVSGEKISTAGRKKLTPESTAHKGVDMDSVLSAYKKKK